MVKLGRGGREWGGFGPFPRMTAQAREVYVTACYEAERRGNDFLGSEHLLLALFSVPDGVIAKVLENLGLKKDEIEARVDRGGSEENGRLHHSPQLKRVVQDATAEARRLNHRYVAPEHLLLGMAMTHECTAYRILSERGVTLERARSEVVSILSNSGPVETESGNESAGTTVVMCRVDDRALGALDTLIEAGICSTRSDAAAWLIQAGIESNTSLFEAIYETVVEIRRLRETAQSLVRGATKRPPVTRNDQTSSHL